MIKGYKVITLCGSTKFKEQFLKAQKDLTLQGNIVITVGLFGHADGEYETGVITDDVKLMLDDMYKCKIDMADEIFVINVDGYVGNSAKSEIRYALSNNKIVRYLEPIEEEPKVGVIAGMVKIDVLKKFNYQKDVTDLSQQVDVDGFGFTIKRKNGVELVYDGTIRKYLK